MINRLLSLLAVLTLLYACKSPVSTADHIYYNAKVWTGNDSLVFYSALVVSGDTIVYAGNDYKAYQGDSTRLHDMQGQLIVPGFIDNHTHFLSGGYNLASVNLRAATSREAFIQTLKDFCQSLPDDRWVLGGDWDHEAWGGALPEKEWIDSVCGNHPVFLSRYDGHMAFANSKALALAGINSRTVAPVGGALLRNAKNHITGVLKDEAMNLVYRVIPTPTEKELDEYFLRAQQHAFQNGVTQIHDVGSFGGWLDLATYQRNQKAGLQSLRIYAFTPLGSWQRLDSFCRNNGKGNDLLRWGGLKGFVDGSLGSTTAWFYQPYLDEPGTAGFTVTDTPLLREWILGADKAGLQVAIHAIGDRANDFILNVYRDAVLQNGPRDRRFRIEHAQHPTAAAIARFNEQRVIPSMQPYHAIDDGKWAWKRLDSLRLKTTYAFRSVLNSGARLTFGSDWTVAPLEPLQGIYAAVTRQTLDGKNPQGWFPEEKITVAQALTCYTVNNAYAGFQENKLGRLQSGQLADFVVLSQDLFTLPPDKLKQVKVVETVINGKTVYRVTQ